MSLEIAEREREGIPILDLKGRIVVGNEASAFRDAFDRLTTSDGSRLLLNMKMVDYVDSTGLGAIVMCATRTKSAGGAAKLVHVNRRQIELLVVTKLDTLFEIFDDETDAVNSFFPERKIKRFDILSFVQHLDDE
jgi:anti-sigma B factor antagonist